MHYFTQTGKMQVFKASAFYPSNLDLHRANTHLITDR